MKDLLLNHLLQLDEATLNNTKIKFNQWNGETDPMEAYKRDPDMINNQWLFWRTEKKILMLDKMRYVF